MWWKQLARALVPRRSSLADCLMFCVAKKTSLKVLHKSSNKDILFGTKVLEQANKRTTRSFCLSLHCINDCINYKNKGRKFCNLLHENALSLCIAKLHLLLTCGSCHLRIPASVSVVCQIRIDVSFVAPSSVITNRTPSQSNLKPAFRLISYLNKA